MKTFEKNIAGFISLFLVMSLVMPDWGWAAKRPVSRTPVSVQQVRRVLAQQLEPVEPFLLLFANPLGSKRNYLKGGKTTVSFSGLVGDINPNSKYQVSIYGMRGNRRTLLGNASLSRVFLNPVNNGAHLSFNFTSKPHPLQNAFTDFKIVLFKKEKAHPLEFLDDFDVHLPVEAPAPAAKIYQALTQMLNPNTRQRIQTIAELNLGEIRTREGKVARFSYPPLRRDPANNDNIEIQIYAHTEEKPFTAIYLGAFSIDRDGNIKHTDDPKVILVAKRKDEDERNVSLSDVDVTRRNGIFIIEPKFGDDTIVKVPK